MIGFLRGNIVSRIHTNEVVIEVNGVGYRVTIGLTLSSKCTLGSPCVVYTYTHVREDALVLFGFETNSERECFEILIGAHGVGPSLAMAILSAHTPNSLASAIVNDDVDALKSVSGVGAKTAARMLIELKSKFDSFDFGDTLTPGSKASKDDPEADSGGGNARNDVRLALGELGYSAEEIKRTLSKLSSETDSKALLRKALAALSKS